MDLSKHVGERVIYGVLDFMGDVGGFIDALQLIGMVFLSFVTFQPLNLFLVKQLFVRSKESSNGTFQ